jgi:hypothetical protein
VDFKKEFIPFIALNFFAFIILMPFQFFKDFLVILYKFFFIIMKVFKVVVFFLCVCVQNTALVYHLSFGKLHLQYHL